MKKKILFALLISSFGFCDSYAQESVSTYQVYDMVKDDHRLYIASKSGVIEYDADAKSYSIATLPDSLVEMNVESAIGKNGEVYAGLSNGHVFKLNDFNYEYIGTVPDKTINKLRFDNEGNVYACARSLYKKTDIGWTRYDLPNSSTASSLGIYDACSDKNGNLWLGCHLAMGGVYKFNGEQITMIDENTGIIKSVAVDDAGQVWLGSMAKGLYLLENGNLKSNFNTSNSSLKEMKISAICVDADGSLWCGRQYLHKYADGVFTAYQMPKDVVINSLETINGIIYIGTSNGVYVFDGIEVSLLNLSTNGINNISKRDLNTCTTYTLKGIKVNDNMLRKGNVYIKNGRKIVK